MTNYVIPDRYQHRYQIGDIYYGAGCVSQLDEVLRENGSERAMIVCGTTVGSVSEVIDPVKAGLDDTLVEVFDETTPQKLATTALDGVEIMEERDVDALVALGGGSSFDVARAMSVFQAEDEPPRELFALDDGSGYPDLAAEKVPIFGVPTTFSGAELTCAAGVNFGSVREGHVPEDPRQVPILDPKIQPTALFYDPELLATTPPKVLAASGLNGLDHGIEAINSRNGNPIVDATATRGIRIVRETLPETVADPSDLESTGATSQGIVLASYGLIDPEADAIKYSVIHAFGHLIARHFSIQQGGVHGIMAPVVLEEVFDVVDGRRDAIAEALGVADPSADAAATARRIVDDIVALRDEVGLPSRLREIPDMSEDDIPRIAEVVAQDVGVQHGPPGFEPDVEEFEAIVRRAW